MVQNGSLLYTLVHIMAHSCNRRPIQQSNIMVRQPPDLEEKVMRLAAKGENIYWSQNKATLSGSIRGAWCTK